MTDAANKAIDECYRLFSVVTVGKLDYERLRAIEASARRMLDSTAWGVDAWKRENHWYELERALRGETNP